MTKEGSPRHPEPAVGPTDTDLVRRAQEGEMQAFATLVERHERSLYNLAYRMLGRAEDARDATQEAFLSCYRHLRSFRGEALFSTWLHRIAVNACYDLLRKRRDEESFDDRSVAPAPAADHADSAALSADVQRALLLVPEEFRVVLVLHEINDLPVEQIARALEIPTGTVKSRLFRGRASLARALGVPTAEAGRVETAASSTAPTGQAREPARPAPPSKPTHP